MVRNWSWNSWKDGSSVAEIEVWLRRFSVWESKAWASSCNEYCRIVSCCSVSIRAMVRLLSLCPLGSRSFKCWASYCRDQPFCWRSCRIRVPKSGLPTMLYLDITWWVILLIWLIVILIAVFIFRIILRSIRHDTFVMQLSSTLNEKTFQLEQTKELNFIQRIFDFF